MNQTDQRDQRDQIRRAQAADIPELLELLLQVNMVHHLGRPDIFKGPAVKYTREQLLNLMDREDAPIFVCAGEDGRIKGHAFCILKHFPHDNILMDFREFYIDDICVREEFRGQGVGRALFEHVREYAKRLDCHNLALNVWSCNPGAMAFYTSLGLVPYKTGMELLL